MNELIYASQFEWRVCTRARECLNLAAEISSWSIHHRGHLTEGLTLEEIERAKEEVERASRLLAEVLENAQRRAA